MNALRLAVSEIFGLFVEDVGYAAAILAWVAIDAFTAGAVGAPLRGGVLFIGLAAILLVEVVRSANRR